MERHFSKWEQQEQKGKRNSCCILLGVRHCTKALYMLVHLIRTSTLSCAWYNFHFTYNIKAQSQNKWQSWYWAQIDLTSESVFFPWRGRGMHNLGKRNAVTSNMIFLKCSIMSKRISGVHKEASVFCLILTGVLDRGCAMVQGMGKSCALCPSGFLMGCHLNSDLSCSAGRRHSRWAGTALESHT